MLSKRPVIFNILRKLIEFNFFTLKKTIRNEFALSRLPLKDSRKILDVPCGTGEFSMLFHPSSYVGIDISQTYINYAKKRYKRTFYCKDAIKTDFEESYFDCILILGFFHHLDNKELVRVVNELKRILKKTGKILLIEDSPISSEWNLIGKFLQLYDIGEKIRPIEEYIKILNNFFVIKKYYRLSSGFWNYSVFELSQKYS